MKRLFLAALLLTAATSAAAADWRLLYTGEDDRSANFVDLHSIAPRNGSVRRVATYQVNLNVDANGAAATMVEIKVDCRKRQMKVLRIVAYDEENRQVSDLSGKRPWIGNFPPGTQGDLTVAYICSNGASDAEAQSWGAALPFRTAREGLRKLQN